MSEKGAMAVKKICYFVILGMLLGYVSVISQQKPSISSQTRKQVQGLDRERYRAASPMKLKLDQASIDHALSTTLVCPTDPYEPNDSLAIATPIAEMQTKAGAYICPPDERDYYVFTAKAAEHIIAYVIASQTGSQLDPMLGLYDSTGTELAFNDDYNGLDPLINYILPADGKYYLGVMGYSNKAAPNPIYSITLTSLHVISGMKFDDINYNGIKETSDTGLAGWTIQLNGDTGVRTTVTDAKGFYQFRDLPTGYYQVSEQQQNNWVQIYPPSGTWYFDLVSDTTADFGNFQAPPSRVHGTLFNDLDDNGTRGLSEPGIAGWSINISGNNFDTTVLTDSAGNYSVPGVPAGYRNICMTALPGWFCTLPENSCWDFLLVGLDTEADFGVWLPPPNKIYGVKFEDKNKDGIRDIGEEGLTNWTIELRRYSGSTVVFDTTTVTDDSGRYKFENLIYGDYGVYEQEQSGWVETYPTAGYWYFRRLLSDTVEADFGNWNSKGKTGDLRCTFTAVQLETAAKDKEKPSRPSSPSRPTAPNYGNIVNTIISGIRAGLSGQIYYQGGSGEMAYLQPSKYTDVWNTFWSKGFTHLKAARGLDLDDNGKVMRKRWKYIAANKKNDIFIRDLLTFKINLLASADSLTHPGLGSLTYWDPPVLQHPLHNKTLNQIAAYADTIITDWGGVSYSTYTLVDTVIARINNAFAAPGFSFDADGWGLGTLYVQGIKTVADVSFLRDGTDIVPVVLRLTPPQVPKKYALYQNYPNPFNPVTEISFDLPVTSTVTLTVYDILGQEIATIINHAVMEEGVQDVEFDGSNLPSGVYFYRLTASGVATSESRSAGPVFTDIKKMMLVK